MENAEDATHYGDVAAFHEYFCSVADNGPVLSVFMLRLCETVRDIKIFAPHNTTVIEWILLLVYSLIARALAAGVPRLDFLRGNESYKYAWGAVDEPVQRLLVRRRDG